MEKSVLGTKFEATDDRPRLKKRLKTVISTLFTFTV